MLATVNPHAAGEADPHRDRRRPYVGQIVTFHMRPGEGRGGKMTAPALVLNVEDDDHVELMILFAADDFVGRWKIPRKTDQNNVQCWSFNEHDEFNYRDDSPLRESVNALATQVHELNERIAALEPPKEHKRGPGRPPKAVD